MRKVLAILLTAVMTAALSGCNTHPELNELAIAEAIGIDKAEDGYTVTMQYFNTDTTGGTTAIDSSQPNAVTVSGTGETIESAIQALSYNCGKSVMLGSAGLIIFGRDAAYDILDKLSFAMSHYSGNPRAFIAVSETSASDILNVKFSEGNASVEKLEAMLHNAQRLGFGKPSVGHEAAELLSCPTGSVALTMLKASESGSELTEKGNTVIITGGAVCTDGSFAAKLTPEQMSGLGMLTENGSKCEMTVIFRRKDIRVMIYGTKTKIVPTLTDETLTFDIEMSGECKIVSSQLSDPYSDRNAIEHLAEEEIKRRVSSMLADSATALGADIAAFAYKIRAHSPDLWRTVSADYRSALRSAKFNISCEFRMERFGITHG